MKKPEKVRIKKLNPDPRIKAYYETRQVKVDVQNEFLNKGRKPAIIDLMEDA